ncbi:MAG TPA: DUF3014 domain-containing protein [Steroidobacteraceae bacterium]|jgi:hypothetical protein|nr:DUF3014 domain-containing protein [Steroidobacteraceae bacterium]
MVNRPVIVIAAVVVAAGLGAAYYFHTRNAQAPHTAAVPSAPAAPASEPAIEHPVPSSPSAASAPLPALNDSDPAIKDALAHALGNEAMQYLVPESIVRHLVVTIDNLPRQKMPAAKRPTVSLGGPFLAQGDEVHGTLDPKNYARYEPMVNVVRKLDMQRVADVYFKFYPLFQSAYQDLGYPNGYFNDRLVAVIDSLLAAPEPPGPIELTRPNVMYLFADPKLEALPAGQKLLIRMGPENAAIIKAKLKELRSIVAAARPGAAASTAEAPEH